MGLHPYTILQSHTLHQEYLTPGDKCILSIHHYTETLTFIRAT